MGGSIYLLQADERLVEMTEQPYDSEDFLQHLLASYPNLLAGEQMDGSSPRRWLLVSRELALPSEEGSGGRWSVDHLFLDQDAIPTVVEVKRSSDSRIRREVVGQMLDYAANAVVYWPIEVVRARYEANCAVDGRDPNEDIGMLLRDSSTDSEQFWIQAKTNLQAGKIRLVFVADVIPPELRRIVEFLNTQMNPAQVLAVEIKQYAGQGLTALVPRVVGQTAQAGSKSGSATTKRLSDHTSFLQDVAQQKGAGEEEAAALILDWAATNALRVRWGVGNCYIGYDAKPGYKDKPYWLLSLYSNAILYVHFSDLMGRPPFADEGKRRELLDRLNEIRGVIIGEDKLMRYPSIRLSVLHDHTALQQLLAAFDWALREIHSTH